MYANHYTPNRFIQFYEHICKFNYHSPVHSCSLTFSQWKQAEKVSPDISVHRLLLWDPQTFPIQQYNRSSMSWDCPGVLVQEDTPDKALAGSDKGDNLVKFPNRLSWRSSSSTLRIIQTGRFFTERKCNNPMEEPILSVDSLSNKAQLCLLERTAVQINR